MSRANVQQAIRQLRELRDERRIRVSGAFVTRFYEEWKSTGDTMVGITVGEKHARVERFLEAMKYELAEVLFEAVENSQSPKITVDNLSPRE